MLKELLISRFMAVDMRQWATENLQTIGLRAAEVNLSIFQANL